jgi:dTDP-4-dehydrorhamnose reductase
LGEVTGKGALTIRTSIIGRELASSVGLVEWFLSNRGGRVRGFQRAIYSGFTTREIARLLADIAEHHSDLHGLWQVSSDPISKYDLLTLVNEAFDTRVQIDPDDSFVCDRSLSSTRFRAALNYNPPSWSEMIRDLRSDPTPYDSWKR